MTLLIVYYTQVLQCVTLLHITGYCDKYYHASVVELITMPASDSQKVQFQTLAEVIFFAIRF